ncbi:MAG: MBL fold metallo-hydrolase [Brevinema sp.]
MQVTFWGVRGSYPSSEMDKMQFGGHTFCIEVRFNNGDVIIIDAGTGIIPMGKAFLKDFADKPLPLVKLFLTHTHWDHIQGFPFFPLAFQPEARIVIYGPVKIGRSLENIIVSQLDPDYSPVRFSLLPAEISFVEIDESRFEFAEGIVFEVCRHPHPGGAYSYRIEADGKVLVINTDVEHYPADLDERVVHISRGADLMIHDAQYTEKEIPTRIGWGHSTFNQAIAVAKQAKVKTIGFTHHDPDRTDDALHAIEREAKLLFPESFFCRQGQTITL